jgi:muramidase (phage lysozyme)
MSDKYHAYRPLLNLIGKTEGTDKGQCYQHVCAYDVTLGYGAYTDGPVDLTSMTLREIDALQTRMLRHPKNKWNSSAVGRYQIVRTTLRVLKKQLGLSDDVLYDEETQDMLAVTLLKSRGVDKHVDGTLTEDRLINNLAKEWASLPKTNGKGHYGGQHAAVPTQEVRDVLARVRMGSLKPLSKSRTLAGVGMTATGGTGAVIAEKNSPPDAISETGEIVTDVSQQLFGLASMSEIVMYLFLLLSVAGIGLTIWARLDDRKRERR